MIELRDYQLAGIEGLRAGIRAGHRSQVLVVPTGAGEAAARRTGRPYCMAPTVGWDANDWHAEAGLLPLRVAISDARRSYPM